MPEKDICQDLNNLKARLELTFFKSLNKAGWNSKNTLKIEFKDRVENILKQIMGWDKK